MALLAALVGFSHVLVGFQNRQLVSLVASLLDRPYGHRQATYDLRRLRRKGLIYRVPNSQRYQLTPVGRAVAVLFSQSAWSSAVSGLAILDPALPAEIVARTPPAVAWRTLNNALDNFIDEQLIAA